MVEGPLLSVVYTMRSDSFRLISARGATSDADALPLTDEDFKRMKRTPRAKIIRRALGLTQQEFATRFRIPLGTLRDWEQGAADPDRAALAYLTVIARNPDAVTKALLSSGGALRLEARLLLGARH